MKKWILPPKIKVHEALGAIGDERIKVNGNEAEVFSSSKGKSYTVKYEPETNSIMANDNGSYWKGYLGYPSIAFLMLNGRIKYNPKYAEGLKGIAWKDLNTNFKNDFRKTEDYIIGLLEERGITLEEFNKEVDSIYEQIEKLDINMLGNKVLPPEGY